MANGARKLDELIAARHLKKAGTLSNKAALRFGWSYKNLSGRLIELGGGNNAAPLTAAVGLVLDAQKKGETAVWITSRQSCFFPPDVADGGVDLDALVVIRLHGPSDTFAVADKLIRSSGFGLVVMDLDGFVESSFSSSMWSRLANLARKHNTAVVLLKKSRQNKQGTLPCVSLSAITTAKRVSTEPQRPRLFVPDGHISPCIYKVTITTTKDKYHASNWSWEETCYGPDGLR